MAKRGCVCEAGCRGRKRDGVVSKKEDNEEEAYTVRTRKCHLAGMECCYPFKTRIEIGFMRCRFAREASILARA